MKIVLLSVLIIYVALNLGLAYTNMVSSIITKIFQTAEKLSLYEQIKCLVDMLKGYTETCNSCKRVIHLIKDEYIKDDKVLKDIDTYTGYLVNDSISDALKNTEGYIILMLEDMKNNLKSDRYALPDWLLPTYVKKEREVVLKDIDYFMKELKEKNFQTENE